MKTLFCWYFKMPIWFQGFSNFFSGKNFTSKTFFSPKLISSFQVRNFSHDNIRKFSGPLKV